jgi:hypothetical protein
MNFTQNEVIQQVAHVARDFAQKHILPHVMEWDESSIFPKMYFMKWVSWGLWAFLYRKSMVAVALAITNM